MTSLWCLIGLIISAVAVSGLGAAFSIFGLAELFAGAVLSVILMSGALEFAKFFIAAYLHQSWPRLKLIFKVYLLTATVVLSLITSMGIFGYLSSAYQEASSKLETENIKLSSLKTEQQRYSTELDRLLKALDEIPANRITKRMQARAEAEPAIVKLRQQIDAIAKQITEADLHIVEVKKRVGPLIYIAKAFDKDIDSIVKYLILVFVSVFDPLAICLVIAVSESLASRQNFKNQPVQAQSQQQPIAAVTAEATITAENSPNPQTASITPEPSEEGEAIHMRFAEDKKKVV